MKIRTIALTGAAAVAFASLLSVAPAAAFTHHPATPAEIQQTDALNAQALANAQMGTQPNQPSAAISTGTTTDVTPATPAPDTTTATPPADNSMTPATPPMNAPTPPPAPPATPQ
ncbi:MAG TPA: hypothetical protein VHZ78_04755 [Rhizomicrobium sp.]|jgi:hypothetical protein|nr:hypothetical protein [Rhizomicrobium sp.]